jgi:hypothetical protein
MRVSSRRDGYPSHTHTAGANHAIFDDGLQLRLLDPSGVVGTSGQSWAFSINNRDDIAGAYTDTTGAHHGYVHHVDSSITQIDFPDAIDMQAFGVNDLGTVIGIYNNRQQILGAFADAAKVQHNFLKTGHDFRPFDLPARFGASFVSAQTVNDLDEIVGYYQDASSVPHGFVATRVRH